MTIRLRPTPAVKRKRRQRKLTGRARRRIRAGAVAFVTCRTLFRRYLFRPCRKMNRAFRYIVTHYAKKWGVELYGFILMSTHYHLLGRDTRGVMSDFMRDVNRELANAVHEIYETSGPVFDNDPSIVEVFGHAAIAQKLAYTYVNATAAAAVRDPSEWPGAMTNPMQLGLARPVEGARPDWYGDASSLPEHAKAELVMPEALLAEYGSESLARAAIEVAVKNELIRARQQVKERGWKYRNADWARSRDPFAQASVEEVPDKRVPHLSVYGLPEEEQVAEIAGWVHFQDDYTHTRERFLEGDDVVWPHGTWAMVRYFGQVAEAA